MIRVQEEAILPVFWKVKSGGTSM